MKAFLIFVSVLPLLLAGSGCSKSTVNSNEVTNANVAADPPFAHITDANVALAEGDRLFDENQTEMAIEAYRQAVKLNPDLAEAHFKLGIAYSLLDKQNEVSGNVTQPDANTKDGKSKTHAERAFEKAVEAYKKWIDANPKDHGGYYYLGRTYVKLLKDEEAEKAFKEAVRLKPDDTEYQTELGAILIRLAQYHEAIGPLKKAVELDPANVRAQELLEDAQAGRQRLDYVPPKNTNQAANKASNSNANANSNSNSNSNSVSRPPDANTKPGKNEPKNRKPPQPGNRP